LTVRRMLLAVVVIVLAAAGVQTQDPEPGIKITSPLGRTGLTGTIRIVARIDTDDQPSAVRFFVDDVLLATDTDGAPYDALWADDNPFEARHLRVEADFGDTVLRDALTLNPVAITEVAQVRSVAIEATVLDEHGKYLKDLTTGDFSIAENATKESIDLVRDQREPALFTLLIDSSQSMSRHSETIRKAAARLLAPLAKADRVVVAPFSRGVVSVTGPTADRQTVLDAIAAIKPRGGTAILDSLREVAGTLRGEQSRRAVVLITDGYDENSESTPELAAEALRESGLALYVVGLGGVAGVSLQGEVMLTKLAADTGGRAWFPRDTYKLVEAYEAISADVAQKYLITYTPTDQRRDGSWRAIDLRVNRKGALVRTRSGYMAPIPPPVRASLEFTAVGSADLPVSLAPDSLVVREDGVEQKVDTFQEAVLPVTIMLALDSSGSMTRSAEQAQAAARDFVASLRPEDELGMIMFADKSNYIHSPTIRRDYSLKAIDEYKAVGGTALYDALYDSLAQVGSVKAGRRVVVVVTDGRDENNDSNGPGSLRSWADVLAIAQKTEATIYAVGIGTRVDRSRLLELAAKSGGAAYFPADSATLSANYSKILDELRRRYVLGYASTNRTRDGKWRAIELGVKGGGVLIRSRGGYFAPAAE
jgi:Ca-activated chloride channel homolog